MCGAKAALHLMSDLQNNTRLMFKMWVKCPSSPGALDLYPDKIHNKLIFSEKVPRDIIIIIIIGVYSTKKTWQPKG